MIELKEITKVFNAKNVILNKVTMTIESGDFVAIVGKSGSGKSTLLNIIGLLDQEYQGEYQFDGEALHSLPVKTLERIRTTQMGYIFQSYNLINEYSVLENVELPLGYRNMNKKERLEKVTYWLDRLGIVDKLHQRPIELSGGEQQRVAIARTLVTEPRIILADEPTGSVDTHTREVIVQLFKELNTAGATICLVTHDNDIAKNASKQVHISDGIVTLKEVSDSMA